MIRNEESIFAEAFEKESSAERAAYLDEACGDNRALRENVESLLEAYPDGEFLESAAAGRCLAFEMLVFAEQVGTTIGPYKLREQIGDGGFGVVYVAEQEQPVRRKVALKIVKPGMDTREVIGRFEAERQALALMDHPNVAKVLDAGATDSGRPYFVMELVRGLRITEFCDQQKLKTRQRLELFVDVCRAVQHAHQKGIIHRDIKPSNVMVTLHDGRPVSKVIDFGVAKAISQRLSEHSVYTAHGQMVGTPLYMSPEQAELGGLDVDTRTDVYSLGVLLYELLTGTTPFDSETLKQAGFDEMRRMIREDEPPRPSNRINTLQAQALSTIADQRTSDVRKLSQTLRGDLDWIVMKAIEKDRNQRYESASAFAADVERYLGDEPIEARRPTLLGRAGKWSRRHRAIVSSTCIAAAVSLLTAMVLLAISNAAIRDSRNQKDEALAIQRKTLDEKERALATVSRQHKLLVNREASLRTQLYAQDVKLAWLAWYNADMEQARRLLIRHVPEKDQTDLRTFAWHYLWLRCQNPVDLPGHQGNVYHVTFSPDGRLLASASADQTIRLWDVETGQLQRTLTGHTGEVNCVAFSPNGRLLATASDDQTARIWDVASGRELRTLDGFQYQVTRVLFSSDSGLLAVAEHFQELNAITTLWDPQTGQQQGSFDQQFLLTFSPDGRTLASSGVDRRVHFWDVESREDLGSFGTDQHTRVAAFDPNGNVLATGSANGHVTLWNVASRKKITQLTRAREQDSHGIQSIDFSSAGDLLVSASDDGTVRLWAFQLRTPVVTLRSQEAVVRCAVLSPDARSLATCGDDGTLRLWRINRRRLTFPNAVTSLAFLAESDRLAIAADDRTLRILDASSGHPHEVLHDLVPEVISAVAFCPGRELVGIGTVDGRVQLFDPHLGELVEDWKRHDAPVREIAFSLNGSLMASIDADSVLRLCGVDSGTQLLKAESATDLAFSSDGQRVMWQRNGNIHRFDISTNKTLRLPIEQLRNSHCLAVSPDGKLLATTGMEASIVLWESSGQRMVKRLLGHQHTVFCLTFSPDGKTLVSGSGGGEVKLWDIATGQELFSLVGHTVDVSCAVFAADGKTLVTAGGPDPLGHGEVFVWQSEENQLTN